MPAMQCRMALLLLSVAVQAFQISQLNDAGSTLPAPDLATKRLRDMRIFHGTSGWVPGGRGTNACPPFNNVVPATEEECQAIVDLSPVGSTKFAGVVTKPRSPKGCFYYMGPSGVEFAYNQHSVGSGDFSSFPVCKSNDFLIGKGKCPEGTIPVRDPDVCMGVENSFHGYTYNGAPLNSDHVPPGCVSRAGQAGVRFNAHPTGGFNPVFYDFCVLPPPETTSTEPKPPVSMDMPPIPQTKSLNPMSGPSKAADMPRPVSANGDPHMTNMAGVKFDIAKPGQHLFIQIPQNALTEDSLLLVRAEVQHVGVKCEDMYIKVLNVTGTWADQQLSGGFSWVSANATGKQLLASSVGTAEWKRFGIVDLKVVRGYTKTGIDYLNMFARHLRDASRTYDIGGILGLDDHSEAATPEPQCKKVLSLLEAPSAVTDRSFAEASL